LTIVHLGNFQAIGQKKITNNSMESVRKESRIVRLSETAILYNPAGLKSREKGIKLVPYPTYSQEEIEKNKVYQYSIGAVYSHVQNMTTAQKTRYLFIEAMHLIVRDGLDANEIHNTFCEIREYRYGLAPDSPVPKHLADKFRIECQN
jgi:hypothetical protein